MFLLLYPQTQINTREFYVWYINYFILYVVPRLDLFQMGFPFFIIPFRLILRFLLPFIADAVVSIYMRELYYIWLPAGRALANRTHVITNGMRISVMQVANNVLEPNASMIRPE